MQAQRQNLESHQQNSENDPWTNPAAAPSC